MMWNTVAQISTGIALVAFIIAAAVAAYKVQLDNRVKIIQSVPSARRSEILQRELNSFDIQAKNLDKKQQYDLAIRELNLRRFRFLIVSIIVGIIAILATAIAIYAVQYKAPDASISSGPAFPVSGRIEVDPETNITNSLKIAFVWAIEDDYIRHYDNVNLSPTDKITSGKSTDFSFSIRENPPKDEHTMFLTEAGFRDISEAVGSSPALLARLAIGYFIAYEDNNGTGLYGYDDAQSDDSDQNKPSNIDVIRGVSEKHAIVYFSGQIHPKMNTLSQLKQGYQVGRIVPPEQHGIKTGFDDIVPVDARTIITLRIPKDPKNIRFPNWT